MKLPLLLSTLSLVGWGTAFAESRSVCYDIDRSRPDAHAGMMYEKERWCYQNMASPQGSVFVFNGDTDSVRPELAFIVEPDGSAIHASMNGGEMSVHQLVNSDYNPFQIPTKEPWMSARRSGEASEALSKSALETYKYLSSSPRELVELQLVPGQFSAQSSHLPWHGFWWPYKNQPLATGANSPLAKYDAFVAQKTGVSPGAQAWESANHKYQGVPWSGHCNGWAASAILRAEPQGKTVNGITFTAVDQKGLLAESDYCVSTAFFGKRYRGSGDDPRDIGAALFHQTLIYYLGNLRKNVAMDYKQKTAVDNHIISGYKMKIQDLGANTFAVETKLTIHKYDSSRTEAPGSAPIYNKVYHYQLTTDAAGKIIGGIWGGSTVNPDFLWVPLATSTCIRGNPQVLDQYVDQILAAP